MTKIVCQECNTKIKQKVPYCPFCGAKIILEKKDKTDHIIVILDRSGSMSSNKYTVIEQFNQFLNEQRKLDKPCKISLHQFDDIYETVYEDVDLKDAPYLSDESYEPRGMTALYDSIGKTMNNLNKNNRTLICIITDGLENASKEFTQTTIHTMIGDYKKKYGWSFAFIGAGIDAYKASSQLNIGRGQTLQISNNNTGFSKGIKCFAGDTLRYRGGPVGMSFIFSEDSKTEAEDDES